MPSGNCTAAAESGTSQRVQISASRLTRVEYGWLGRRIVVVRVAHEDAAVEHSAGDDGDAALDAERQQLVERTRVEERVPTREQQTVDVGLAREASEHLGLVHADADRAHDTFAAEPFECGVRTGQSLVEMVVRIVNVHDVDAVEAKALEAFVE